MGIKPWMSTLKEELLDRSQKDIEDFVRTSVDGWDEDDISCFLDEVIEQKTEEELIEAARQYVGDKEFEPDELESEMVRQIQALIAPGHACIMTEISWENLRSLDGTSLIITQEGVDVVDLAETAVNVARAILGDETYSPDMIY